MAKATDGAGSAPPHRAVTEQGSASPATGDSLLKRQILAVAADQGVQSGQDEALAEIVQRIEAAPHLPTEAVAALAEIITQLCNEDEHLSKRDVGESESRSDQWT